MGPSSPWTEASFSEMAHGTARAASASATGQPSARRSSSPESPDSNREAARLKVVKIQQSLTVMGDTDGVAVECLKAEVGEGKKGLPETPTRCRGRRVPEVHSQVLEAHCRVGPRARVGAVRVDQCQGTSSDVGNRAVSSRGRGTSSCGLEGPDGSIASTSEFLTRRTDQAVHSPALKRQAVGHVSSVGSFHQCPLWFLQSWTIGCKIFSWSSRVSMNLGDQRRVVEVRTKLAEGASQMVYLTGGMAT